MQVIFDFILKSLHLFLFEIDSFLVRFKCKHFLLFSVFNTTLAILDFLL